MQSIFFEVDVIWERLLLYNLDISFSIDGDFKEVQTAHSIDIKTPPFHQRCTELSADNALEGHSAL